ncbi:ABC transporter substrate-binding protein [Aureimonas sp. SA4125]|uniref:ABC transporter substrate-binding protein n=1 Tax=Aureimonas sp. SA4125 TaxID=2826993 RepID=UPI001CC76E40|nr:ABC transporter substrate-binding protein [Aureimonas sp. SA4125]BDA83866.1 ABC transporter substrate-binding protein [Aureimonas sp. SA4125]
MRAILTAMVAAAVLWSGAVSAAETVRVGVLKFGTVNWELDAMKRNGIDAKHGVDVEIIPFAGEDATGIALQGGSVDMIVTDWLWVSRQRAEGGPYVFAPYSTSVGALMVPGDSPIRTLADLKGKTLGVAGGPLDKNWLLIQALATRDTGTDLAGDARIIYGAPPLLAEKARSGELDAVLIFWNYAARLEAEGFRRLVSGEEAAAAFGASGKVATIGYVFDEGWATAHPGVASGFLAASKETKQLLKTSDAEWQALAPLVQAEDDATLATMRERYREGIPARPVAEEEKDTAKLYQVLEGLAGEKLVGPGKVLDPGTYWSGLKNGS